MVHNAHNVHIGEIGYPPIPVIPMIHVLPLDTSGHFQQRFSYHDFAATIFCPTNGHVFHVFGYLGPSQDRHSLIL